MDMKQAPRSLSDNLQNKRRTPFLSSIKAFSPQAVKDHPRLYGDQCSRIRPRTLLCREPQITWLTSFTSLTARSSETPEISIVAFFVFIVIVATFAFGSSAGSSI